MMYVRFYKHAINVLLSLLLFISLFSVIIPPTPVFASGLTVLSRKPNTNALDIVKTSDITVQFSSGITASTVNETVFNVEGDGDLEIAAGNEDLPVLTGGKVIPAQSIMEEPAVVIRSHQDIEICISEMAAKRTPVAFVVGPFNRIKGIITMKEAISVDRKGPSQVGDVARKDFPSTSPDSPLDEILHLVAEGNIPVAVLDEEQHLLGVVTRTVLIQAMQSDNEPADSK